MNYLTGNDLAWMVFASLVVGFLFFLPALLAPKDPLEELDGLGEQR